MLEIVLVGATAIGRDLGPTVSARVATGLTADCTLLEIGDFPLVALPNQEQKHNQLLMTRPAFGGNTIATIACPDNRPQMATVRPGVMQKLDRVAGKKAEVIEYNPGFTTAREHDTCPPSTSARSSRSLKFSAEPTPRPPETRILASMISLISETAFEISRISTYLLFGVNPGLYSITSAFLPATLSSFCITPGRTVAI